MFHLRQNNSEEFSLHPKFSSLKLTSFPHLTIHKPTIQFEKHLTSQPFLELVLHLQFYLK